MVYKSACVADKRSSSLLAWSQMKPKKINIPPLNGAA